MSDNHHKEERSRTNLHRLHHAHDGHDQKTKREKFAEDLVYTLNHAVVCGATDLADPFIGGWLEHKYGKHIELSLHHRFEHLFEKLFKVSLGDHHEHKIDFSSREAVAKSFRHNLGEWFVGEAVGDIGAVPVTMAIQHVAPGFMRGIQYITEPILGPAFRFSANLHTRKWAYDHGLASDSEEARARAEEVYQHEVTHLPHAFVWTGTAAIGNVATQKLLFKGKSIPVLAVGKAAGSVATLVTVLGLRALAPGVVQKIDDFNSRNIAEPVTRWASGLLGIDDETVDRVLEREREFADGHQIMEKSHHSKHSHDKPHSKIISSTVETLPPLQLTRLIG